MERLTERKWSLGELIGNSGKECSCICQEHEDCNNCPIQKAFNKLKAYEDAEENFGATVFLTK